MREEKVQFNNNSKGFSPRKENVSPKENENKRCPQNVKDAPVSRILSSLSSVLPPENVSTIIHLAQAFKQQFKRLRNTHCRGQTSFRLRITEIIAFRIISFILRRGKRTVLYRLYGVREGKTWKNGDSQPRRVTKMDRFRLSAKSSRFKLCSISTGAYAKLKFLAIRVYD